MLILSFEFPELPLNVINPSPSLAKKVTEKENSSSPLTIEKADVIFEIDFGSITAKSLQIS